MAVASWPTMSSSSFTQKKPWTGMDPGLMMAKHTNTVATFVVAVQELEFQKKIQID